MGKGTYDPSTGASTVSSLVRPLRVESPGVKERPLLLSMDIKNLRTIIRNEILSVLSELSEEDRRPSKDSLSAESLDLESEVNEPVSSKKKRRKS